MGEEQQTWASSAYSGMRLLWLDEPEQPDALNMDTLRELTSDEPIPVRNITPVNYGDWPEPVGSENCTKYISLLEVLDKTSVPDRLMERFLRDLPKVREYVRRTMSQKEYEAFPCDIARWLGTYIAVNADWYDERYCSGCTFKLYAVYQELVCQVGTHEALELIMGDRKLSRWWGRELVTEGGEDMVRMEPRDVEAVMARSECTYEEAYEALLEIPDITEAVCWLGPRKPQSASGMDEVD